MWTFKVIRKESSGGGNEVKLGVKASAEKLLACRSCLGTEGKLYDLHKYKLAHHMENLTGHPVLPTDGLPQHICNVCGVLLQKAALFRARCERARLCLQYASLQLPELTTNYIRSLDRSTFKIPLSFTKTLTVKITNDLTQPKHNIDLVSDKETFNRVNSFNEPQESIDNVTKDNQQLQPEDDDFRPFTDIDDSMNNEWSYRTHNKIQNEMKTNISDNNLNSNMETVLFTTTDVDFTLFSKTYNVDVVTFTSEEQFEEMQRRKVEALNSKLSCDLCYKILANENLLKNHLVLHNPASGGHECGYCHLRFHKKLGLIKHLQRHKYRFKCRICDQVLINSQRAMYHHHSHQGLVFPCQHCDKIFTKLASRLNHIRIHHGSAPCDICYDTFQSARAVDLHKSLMHRQIYECMSCNLYFDSGDAVDTHLRGADVCDPQIKPCRRCGENFPTDELLTEHIEQEHRRVKNKQRSSPNRAKNRSTNRKQKKCCPCTRSKRRKLTKNTKSTRVDTKADKLERTSLSKHDYFKIDNNPQLEISSKSRLPSDNAECEMEVSSYKDDNTKGGEHIGEVIKQNGDDKEDIGEVIKQNGEDESSCPCVGTSRQRSCPCLRRGTRRKGDKVMCEMCARSFPSMTTLKYHQRVHTGEKPFQCSYCDKRFRIKESLERHERVHTGERPYKCDECERSFAAMMNLYRHRRTHTGQRPYRCDVCDKRFSQTGALKAHIQSVHMRIRAKPRIRIRKKKTV